MEEKNTNTDSAAGKRESDGGDGPLVRLVHEIRSLVEDIKEWIELRIELLQLDVEDRVQAVANDILLVLFVLVLFFVAFLFLALAAAFALGQWLESEALGFLIVAVVFGLLGASIRRSRMDLATKVGRTLTRPGVGINADPPTKPPVPALSDKSEERHGTG
jgi:hypothetical protein